MPSIRSLGENINKLATWYRKKLDPEQTRILAARLKDIPGEALTEIVDGLIDDSKFFPSINEIRGRWYRWRSSKPDRMINPQPPQAPCADCQGDGCLYGVLKAGGHPYRYLWVCGSCENWRRVFNPGHGIPFETKRSLERQGVTVLNKAYDDPPLEKRYNVSDRIEQLVDGIGGNIS